MRTIAEEEWNNIADTKRECLNLEELKDNFGAWLDDSVYTRGGLDKDNKIRSATTDDGKKYYLFKDIVLTHPDEDLGKQSILMCIERVKKQEDE